MPAKPLPADLPILSFPSAEEFRSFLEREHALIPGIHLKLARKSCQTPSVSSEDALQTALCYGWINGQGNGFDDDWYLARYTPRRPKSLWSQKNVDTVEKLIKEGRMHPSGMAAIDTAKADGRWNRAYATPTNMTVPSDLVEALAHSPRASSRFDELNKSDRYLVLLRIHTASGATRAKRIEADVQMLADGKVPGKTTKASGAKARSVRSARTRKTGKDTATPTQSATVSRRVGLRSRVRI